MSYPSSVPSSRPTVSITPSLPKIVLIATTATSHNVSLTVSLVAAVDSGGAVYCIALAYGSAPQSVGVVQNAGTGKQYLTSKKTVSMVISGLLAMKTYQAYCYVQISDGQGSSIASVLDTQTPFSTQCCQGIAFTNAPATVYGDVALYFSKDTPSVYVFSYTLDSPPSSGSIIISPIITALNLSTPNHTVFATPSSTTFLSTASSTQLTGYFFLASRANLTGAYSITLGLSGPSRHNFTTATTAVTVMKNGQSLPPPRISNCIFDNNGGYVTISFAAPTDQASITDLYWSCDRLFTFTANNNTLCSWTSNKVVKGVFSKVIPTSLKPGDPISINPGILRAACRAGTFCQANQFAQAQIKRNTMSATDEVVVVRHTVTVLPPAVPLVPTLVLSIASQLGACNDLSIDLSASEGTGGRHWASVVFTVISTNGRDLVNTAAFADYINVNFDYVSNHVTVPRVMLGSETYAITVVATNFLGNSASQTASVEVYSDPNLPVVSLLGGLTRTIKALNTLLVEGRAALSNCATSQTLKYNFTLYNSTGGIIPTLTTNIDPRKYSAPAYYFTVGSTYSIILRVALINEVTKRTLSTGYTNFQLYIVHGDVKAAVRLGYSRQVLVNEVLIMDASISSDEDSPLGSTNLLFLWTCSITSQIGFGLPCVFPQNSLINYQAGVFSLPANQLQLNLLYNFMVTVRSKDGRSATQTVQISGLLAGSPVVTSYNTALRFSLARPLVIPGSLTSNVSTLATWTAVSYGYPASLERAYTPISRTFTPSELKNTINYPLAVLPYSFIGGRIYTFRLTASSTLFPSQISVTEVTMTANSPPIGGYLLVTPDTGYALDTLYSMITSGWSDDASDYPFSYNFAYELAISNFIPALALTVNSPLPYAKSALPPGLQGGM